jgi:AcrR family transcriptional regulator
VGKKQELVNTSELARRSGLNRATVRERLKSKGIQPREQKAREKLYNATEAMRALQSEQNSALRLAQTDKTVVEADRARLKLERERGDLVSIHDVRSDIQTIVGNIRRHFLTRAQVLASQLRGQKVARIEAILREDAERFFAGLRAEYEGYLNGSQAES